MKRWYRYIELLIISVLTICLFNMCTNNKRAMEENAVVQIEEEINETDETIEVEENVVESLKREHRTNIKGNNEDVVT